MEKREQILAELQEVSQALAQINKTNVWSVPYAYFTNLPDIILGKIKEREGSFHLSSANPFKVPGGYFEGLADNILKKINTAKSEVYTDLEELAPVLNTISKNELFAVPEGYFEQVAFIAPKPQAKISSLSRTNKILCYAVAAGITGIMAVSSYLYFNNDTTQSGVAPINVAAAVDNLSEEDILTYLETNSTASDVINVNNTSDSALEVNGLLKEMPEEGIREFLNETSENGKKS
ncbi:MAG: hypothetical protein JWQ96_1876 [Segetibacter sp.]|nr:hypothetical protein [Segetibacter sp.]